MRGTTVQGVIIKPGPNKDSFQVIKPELCKNFNLILKKDIPWYIGLDQSTSCTGVALKAADRSFVILLDVIRDTVAPKEEYFRDLHKLLIRLVRDQQIDIIVNEKPVPTEKKKYARQVLTEFLGRLNAWIDDIPELENAQHGALFPQTWKSLVMDKSKGKNRSKIKAEIAADLVDRYPALDYYYRFMHTDDYDAFDALGILEGYIAYAFTPDGYAQIHGSKETSHVSLVLYDWIDWDSRLSFEENIENALDGNLEIFQPYILRYNENHSLHDNIRMASSNYDCTATIIPQKELQPFKWKYGIDPADTTKALMALILRRGRFSVGLVNNAKKVYTWNEEVFNE